MPDPDVKSEANSTVDDVRTSCECTELQRAHGHHYACLYGPLRSLPCVRGKPSTDDRPDTLLEFTAEYTDTGWRLLRVIR